MVRDRGTRGIPALPGVNISPLAAGTWGQVGSGAAAGGGRTGGQTVRWGLREAFAGGQRVMETGGEAAAGVQDRRLLGDLLEKGFSPAWGEDTTVVGKGRAPVSP